MGHAREVANDRIAAVVDQNEQHLVIHRRVPDGGRELAAEIDRAANVDLVVFNPGECAIQLQTKSSRLVVIARQQNAGAVAWSHGAARLLLGICFFAQRGECTEGPA